MQSQACNALDAPSSPPTSLPRPCSCCLPFCCRAVCCAGGAWVRLPCRASAAACTSWPSSSRRLHCLSCAIVNATGDDAGVPMCVPATSCCCCAPWVVACCACGPLLVKSLLFSCCRTAAALGSSLTAAEPLKQLLLWKLALLPVLLWRNKHSPVALPGSGASMHPCPATCCGGIESAFKQQDLTRHTGCSTGAQATSKMQIEVKCEVWIMTVVDRNSSTYRQ